MKSILLIGLGRFGRHIAQELNALGHQVMAIDNNEDRVNAVLSYVTNAQIGDSTSEYFLRSLGVGNFDVYRNHRRQFSKLTGNNITAQGAWCKVCGLPCRARCAGQVPAAQRRRRGSLSGKAVGKVGGNPV